MSLKLTRLGLLAASAVALAVPQSAQAALILSAQIGDQTFQVTDNDENDIDDANGVLRIFDQTVAGINVRGSIQSSRKDVNDQNVLNSSSLEVRNVSNSPLTVRLVVSDTGFEGLSTNAFTSASGTFEDATGSEITLSWYADAQNRQGGETVTDTPGDLIDTFNFTAASLASSFSHDGGPFTTNLEGPYSLTLAFDYLLPAGGALISRGATMILDVEGGGGKPVPEPGAVGLLGLGLLAVGMRRRKAA
jgi:hypothetical protein